MMTVAAEKVQVVAQWPLPIPRPRCKQERRGRQHRQWVLAGVASGADREPIPWSRYPARREQVPAARAGRPPRYRRLLPLQ